MVILDFDFKSQGDKIVYSASSPSQTKAKNVRWRCLFLVAIFESFLEREGNSL